MPTLYHNMECWSPIPNNIYKELERIQYEILRRIFEQKTATPYWGLLADIGLRPIQQYLDYRRILLFAGVIQSEENILIKRIIEDQIKNPYGECWAKLSLETIEKYNLDLEEIRKGKVTKNQIKKAITRAVEELKIKKGVMKKLRFTSKYGQDYVTKWGLNDVKEMMELRLDMWAGCEDGPYELQHLAKCHIKEDLNIGEAATKNLNLLRELKRIPAPKKFECLLV